MNPEAIPRYEWKTLPWRKLERQVFKLQKRIYQASLRGDVKLVRKLQRLLCNSWAAKCLAVRRVTQDNQGKKTAGVDGIKSLPPSRRFDLVNRLRLTCTASPTRRVWIPKPHSQEKRPLGIPTLEDRARQALVKQVLEPEWEAKFEPNSYGFRPGRSCHDAVEAIFGYLKGQDKYVLDADIAQCFDRINHDALLDKLHTSPTLRRQIRAWLKAGVMDGDQCFPTSAGTPQGGVISPLLANIALHGLEGLVQQISPTTGLIRYADDFVVLHKDLAIVQQCHQAIAEWLTQLGLTLKPSKTHLTHTRHPYEGKVGFDFLGFLFRHFPAGKYRSAKTTRGKILGFKTIISPSKQSISTHIQRIQQVITAHRGAPQVALIAHLAPIIRGWTQYFRTVCSAKVFYYLDHQITHSLIRWGRYRHSHSAIHWVVNKYWQTLENNNWRFMEANTRRLLPLYVDTSLRRHIKVKGSRSPYDGDWVYWSVRMSRYPLISNRMSFLLKRQQGRCPICGLYFKDGDQLETDHDIPRKLGGKSGLDNLQLLHRHCHDVKTRGDWKLIKAQRRGVSDIHSIVEEPCAVKAARTVLKPSERGDSFA
jgi:RNA-directed DNA polymerase